LSQPDDAAVGCRHPSGTNEVPSQVETEIIGGWPREKGVAAEELAANEAMGRRERKQGYGERKMETSERQQQAGFTEAGEQTRREGHRKSAWV